MATNSAEPESRGKLHVIIGLEFAAAFIMNELGWWDRDQMERLLLKEIVDQILSNDNQPSTDSIVVGLEAMGMTRERSFEIVDRATTLVIQAIAEHMPSFPMDMNSQVGNTTGSPAHRVVTWRLRGSEGLHITIEPPEELGID